MEWTAELSPPSSIEMAPTGVELTDLTGFFSEEELGHLMQAPIFEAVAKLVVAKAEGMAPDELTKRADAILSFADTAGAQALSMMESIARAMIESGCCSHEQETRLREALGESSASDAHAECTDDHSEKHDTATCEDCKNGKPCSKK